MPDLLCPEPMKIDPRILRRLRDERSWTQEHLATASGLSLRTIQRIEREGNASADSRLALAGAFRIDVSELVESPAQEPPATPPPEDASAGIRSLKRHARTYALGAVLFIAGDLIQSGRLTWAWWPLLGWGAGLLLHAMRVRRLVRRARDGQDPSDVRKPLEEHALLWLVASAIFLFADWHAHGRLVWAQYPILGWGLGLFAHYRSSRRDT